MISVAGHVLADHRQIRTERRGLVDQAALGQHQDPIGQGQQLVEIRADQQHGGAAVARTSVRARLRE